jgi:ATP-binding cassette subfamily C protein
MSTVTVAPMIEMPIFTAGAIPPLDAAAERATVLEALGRELGVVLREPAGAEGRAADPFEAMARASGVRTRRVTLRGRWWRQDCGPLLATLREDSGERLVALLSNRRGGYDLFEPRGGRRALTAAERARLAPTAVMVYPGLPDRARTGMGLARFALRPYLRDLGVILVLALAATLLGMVPPLAMRVLVDEVIPAGGGGRLAGLGLLLAAAACGQAAFALAQGIATVRAQARATASSQAAVLDRLLRLPVSFFRRFAGGDLLNRAMTVTQVSQVLSSATLRALLSGTLALLNLGLLAWYDAGLARFAAAVALAYAGAAAGLGFLVRRRAAALERVRARLSGLVVQLLSGIAKLRAAGAERRGHAHWAAGFAGQLRLTGAVRRLEDLSRLLTLLVPGVACLGLYALAADRVTEGGLTPGAFLAFAAAFGVFSASLAALAQALVDAADALSRRRLLQPILEAEPEATGRADPGGLRGGLGLQRVGFRYRPDGPAVLDGVSLCARPGEFIALVGPSGSGKSTVLRLLLGLESPEAGAVTYDGSDLRGLDVAGVRRQLGVVLQSAHVLSGTLFDNVAAGSPVSQDEVWDAVRDAGLAEDIRALPMGLHTFLPEGGATLSGGQRQRLLIARALLHHPRVLLLDEATSALDNVTQARVADALRRRRVTRVVVAHRLSTIQGADRIYVLSAGRVVQEGTFAELLAEEGLFARMMARQGG